MLGLILALSLLLACGKSNADRATSISLAEQARVLTAVEAFRSVLNQGNCEGVLDPAAEQPRTDGRSQDWVKKCRHVAETWGEWRSFSANYWYRSGDSAIAVEGMANFTRGNCTVQVVWDLRAASPRMVAFFLRSKGDQVDFPQPPSKNIDPPTKEGREKMQSIG